MKWIQPPDDDVLFCCQGVFFIAYFFASKTVKLIHAGQWEQRFLLFLSLWDSPLCDNTQYSNHCVTSPITSLYQKSARSAITLFDSMYLCSPNVFVCDKYVTQVYQWTIRQLHFRPEWQVNIYYCIVVTYQQITDRWHYECQVCKKLHNMQTSCIQSNTLINWNNHETRPQGGCSVGAHCVSQWTIRSAEEEPKYV